MPHIPKRLYIGQPGTSLSTLYTVPDGYKVIIKNIMLINTTSTDAKITIYFVPSGDSANNTNMIISDYAVIANDTVVIDLSAVLESGDTIQAIQTTSGAVTVYVSGVEVS